MKTLTIKLGFDEKMAAYAQSGELDTAIILKGIDKGIKDFLLDYPNQPDDAVLSP